MSGEKDDFGDADDGVDAAAAVSCARDNDGDSDNGCTFWAASFAAIAASPHVSKKLTVKWEVMRVDAADEEGGDQRPTGDDDALRNRKLA